MTLEEFYSNNEARRRSPEADFGVWWRNGSSLEPWRVSYIQATGEVYAVKQRGNDEVQVLGVVPPDPDERRPQPGETRWNLRKGTYYRTLDRILEGWVEHCGQPRGLEWVREKLTCLS